MYAILYHLYLKKNLKPKNNSKQCVLPLILLGTADMTPSLFKLFSMTDLVWFGANPFFPLAQADTTATHANTLLFILHFKI